MRLLVVTSSYPRFAGDIAGRFVMEWAEHLRRRGHQIRVLTWRDSTARGAPLDSSIKVARVPYALPSYETLFYGAGTPENLRENPARALLAVPAAAAMLGRIMWQMARWRPDVVVGHWLVPAGLLARTAGRLTGTPSLVVGHSGGVHMLGGLPKPVGAALASFLTSGPTTVPSLPLAEKLGRLATSGRTTTVLPMGFDLPSGLGSPDSNEGSSGSNERGDSRGGRRDWLCMGRLVDIKGVDLAIEAFARAELPGEPTLHIAGDGPERARLERVAVDRGARVEFHGFVTGRHRERLWRDCGFAIFASKTLDDGRHEGLPVSFLEACSRGLVPLCAPIPGVGAYLVDRGLQQVDERHPAAWAERVEKLAALRASKRERLAAAQRQRVAQLAWPRLIERWEGLLIEVERMAGA